MKFAPPHDIGDITEGANHGDAGALVFLGEVVGNNGYFDPEYRGRDSGAKEWVVVAGLLGVFEFGLCNGGAEGDIPQCWCESLVRLTALNIAHECKLAGEDCVGSDRAIGLSPVDREAEGAPERFKLQFIFDCEFFTQFDKVAAADGELVSCPDSTVHATHGWRHKVGDVGE